MPELSDAVKCPAKVYIRFGILGGERYRFLTVFDPAAFARHHAASFGIQLKLLTETEGVLFKSFD